MYVSKFVSGGLEPFWPHASLLSLSIAASIAVGAGIIFERPKYSASVHRVAFSLIVGGIVIEAICTIFLFVFDEGISGAQQSKIIALERRLAQRSLDDATQDKLVRALEKYDQTPWDLSVTPDAELSFTLQIIDVLKRAKWRHLAWAATSVVVPSSEIPSLDVRIGDPNQAHAVVIGGLDGVEVLYPPSGPERLKEAAEALAAGLQDATIQATAAPIPPSLADVLRPDEIHVRIGSRL